MSSQAQRVSKGKRPHKAVSVIGLAGASLAASTAGSSEMPLQNPSSSPFLLHDEEISDVSLATFHVFDKDGLGTPQSAIQLARGGCGCGHGCGGCGHGCGRGCGGCRGCGHGCGRGCGWGGCGGCWGWGWGTWTGCCLSWGGCRYC